MHRQKSEKTNQNASKTKEIQKIERKIEKTLAK